MTHPNFAIRIERWPVEQAFDMFGPDWLSLLERSEADPLFMSRDWIRAWWLQYGGSLEAEPFVLAAFRGTQLVGIAPLFRRHVRHRLGVPGVRLELMGNAWRARGSGLSERTGFVLDREFAGDAADALFREIFADPEWDDLVLCHAQVEGATPAGLKRVAGEQRGYLRHVDSMDAWDVSLVGGFSAFLERLGPGTRARLIGSRRRLAKAGTLHERVLGPADLEQGWAQFNRLYSARWGRELSRHLQSLYATIVEEQTLRGVPAMSVLEFDGRPFSMLINLRARTREYSIVSAFETLGHKRVSPGLMHLGFAIERAAGDGLTHFDLLGGAGKSEQYKPALGDVHSTLGCFQHIRAPMLVRAYRLWDGVQIRRNGGSHGEGPGAPGSRASSFPRAETKPLAGSLFRSTVVRPHALHGMTAVVTGAEHPTGLGAGRALQQFGVNVTGMTRSPESPACGSSAWRQLVAIEPSDGEADWVRAMLESGNDGSLRAFLLPTQDQLVEVISKHRQVLQERFRFKLPPDEVVQRFLDKTKFFEWAEPQGLPLPDTRIVRDEQDLRAALSDMRYPLVLKPLYRTPAWNRLSPVNKVFRLDRPGDIDAIGLPLFEVASAYVLSHWIAGPDSAVHFCLAYCASPGEMAACYTGRKLLQYPRQTGSTAISVGTDNGEVRELTAEVFRKSGFVGLGSVEFKYGTDGKPYITEPTVGRPNLQSYSAVAAGCNLQALAMADAMDVELPPGRSPVSNCWWVQEEAIVELLTTRGPEPVPWRLLVSELLRARRICGAYWSWRDPRPLGSYLWRKIRRAVRRLFRK